MTYRNRYAAILLASLVLTLGCRDKIDNTAGCPTGDCGVPLYNKEVLVGVDNAGDPTSGPFHLIEPMKTLGVDFMVYHYWPESNLSAQKKGLSLLGEVFDQHDLSFILNTEIGNNRESIIDDDGWNWCSGPNGTHRFTIKPELLALANQYKSFEGVMYDEPAHMQLNRNWIITDNGKVDKPFLGETTGLSFQEADELVHDNAKILVDEIKAHGTNYTLAEHVFPVLFHNFAKSGMTVSYKLMKESWAPMWTACAMGAALQYSDELWSCLDLWFAGVPGNSPMYPGHSPNELKSNLMYSYWVGNNRIYVENLNYQESLYATRGGKIVLNDYGKAVKWFTHEYLPVNPRGYTYRAIKPSIAIIRFDDTDFGIANKNGFPDQLFGSRTLQSTAVTREWMKIWHIVSHGVIPTPEEGISWLSYPLGTPHRSFAPMNNLVVFDDNVEKKHLESLQLAFVSGISISAQTEAALVQLVKDNGLTVVVTPGLAPADIKSSYTGKGTQVITCGASGGKWIVSDDFLAPLVRDNIAHLLGNDGEMRYVFGDDEIIFDIGPNDNLAVRKNKLR